MQVPAAIAPIVNLVFPPRCPLCGEGLSEQQGLCTACWSELAIPGAPCCSLCQRPFPDGMPDGSVCAPCLADPPKHDGIAAGTLYNDASRKLVLAFKHGHRIALAPLLARLMIARLGDIGPDWIVVPVPLHRWRLWRRGFNQAGLLAHEIAQARGAALLVDGLERHRQTPSLGGLGRKGRARALSGAIRINSRRAAKVKGAKILLVDDVLTSGATSSACVSVLRRAGAEQVRIACFARVLDEALPHANDTAQTKTPGTEAPSVLVTKL
ncbi:MAG: ComF family protein [Novosphingobium sp.]